ncbi:MAG: HNH endonuclease [Egibacteraceae bacterium]
MGPTTTASLLRAWNLAPPARWGRCPTVDAVPHVHQRSSRHAKLALYRTLFAGRGDVYARRFENRAKATSGWWPVHKGGPSVPREQRQYLPLTDEVIAAHLEGHDTIGLYPLLPGDTCRLLACDFDKATWRLDVQAYCEAAEAAGLPTAVELSRSGDGAHVWMFFTAPVAAADARAMGAALLREAIALRGELDLQGQCRRQRHGRCARPRRRGCRRRPRAWRRHRRGRIRPCCCDQPPRHRRPTPCAPRAHPRHRPGAGVPTDPDPPSPPAPPPRPRPPRFGSGVALSPATVRGLVPATTIMAVLTLGRWRAVNVGAKHRTLPAWLRTVLTTFDVHCRGTDCDRPAAWTQAHHVTPWNATRTTDLNDTLPLCTPHHHLIDDGWDTTLDHTTGTVTWTSPTGRTITVPPRDPWP